MACEQVIIHMAQSINKRGPSFYSGRSFEITYYANPSALQELEWSQEKICL